MSAGGSSSTNDVSGFERHFVEFSVFEFKGGVNGFFPRDLWLAAKYRYD